jgi:hypothetical protein
MDLIPWEIAILVLCMFAPWPSYAGDTSLLSVGIRGGQSGNSFLGEEAQNRFRQYDAMAIFGLPWEWYHESGWGIGTRLLVSAGAVKAAGDTGFIATLVPGIAFGDKNGRFSLETGGGFAVLSDYKFANQDLGGPFQFVWTIAARAVIYRGVGVGLWFQHISDAYVYGTDSRGFDLHMIELSYKF